MILLKITNSSDVVASKIGKFLERLTPDSMDQSTVEDIVIAKLIENLKAEGIKGEVASVRGVDLHDHEMVIHESSKVRNIHHF
jgi:hypothetical protein